MRRRPTSTFPLHVDDVPADDADSPLLFLARWVQKNTQWLTHQLRRKDRSPEDIDDLIQEAILRVARSCELGGVLDPAAVLVRTVSRLSMDDCRYRSRHPNQSLEEIESFVPFIDPSPLPEEVVAAEQGWALIAEVLDKVDPRTREVFLLHRLHGLSYRQIARQLRMSKTTVLKDVAFVTAKIMNATQGRRSA